jgi:adenylate cyclase class IV
VENLGDFVEIERSVSSGAPEEKVFKIRDDILKTIKEWDLTELERKSYLELLLAKTR